MKAFVGHPVDVVSGGVFTAWHDFTFNGRTPVTWRRFYSSGNSEIAGQGRGWTTEYFTKLERRGANLLLTEGEGHSHLFVDPVDESPTAIPMHGWSLYKSESGYRIFDRQHGKYLHFLPSAAHPDVFVLRRIEEMSGHSLHLRHDHDDRLLEIEQRSLQRRIVFSYNRAGLIDRIDLAVVGWDAMLLVSFTYDDEFHLIRAQDPCGGAIHYAYDGQHRLIKETNKVGGSFYFEYDRLGRCISTWGDGGYLRRTLAYNAEHRITKVTDSTGSVTRYSYAPDGSISSITDALGRVTRFYRFAGVKQRVDSLGSVTETEVNDRGELVRRMNELGHSFIFSYNDRSQIVSITDPGGAVWRRNYDDRGLLVGLSDPFGHEWKLERGAGGEILTQTDPEGRCLRRHYDQLMRWQEIADDVGYFRTEYDVFGRPIVSSNADGLINTWSYDAAGRLIRTTSADGSTDEFEYDANGNIVKFKDQIGAVWSFHYDVFGHLISARDPLGNEVTQEYDTEGRRTKIRNQKGELYQDVYDAIGRVVVRTHFDGSTERYGWNAVGALTLVRRANGATIDKVYDPAGNLIGEEAHHPSDPSRIDEASATIVSTFQYNWRGCVTKATNPTCAIEFQYDLVGNLVVEQQDEFRINYGYDKAGKLIMRNLENGSSGGLQFKYNAAGLLSALVDTQGELESFSYGRAGTITERTMRGALQERRTYDSRHRVCAQVVSKQSSLVIAREYRFDERDNLIAMNDRQRGPLSFHYDAARRLVEVRKAGLPSDTFQYDSGGNINTHNSSEFSYDLRGRLAARDGVSYEYDASGNQTAHKTGTILRRFEYDPYGRLIRIDADAGPIAAYCYDALNRRVKKTDSGNKTTRYIWSNRTLAGIAEDDGPITEILISSRDWCPTTLWKNGQAEHYICNHIGLPQEVISRRGGVVWRAEYAPFGSASVTSVAPSPAYDLRFPGQLEDQESGLFYNWNRYYDPAQSRYITPDPAGIDAGINLYDYPRDPINWTDPLGLSCPNPKLIEENTQAGWQVHQHDDGSLTITGNCTKGFATPKPGGLRATIHAGDANKFNPPEAHLGQDGRLIVMEGTHRSVAASRGQQIPPDPDNPHLGGVPGRPGYMTYEYSPKYNDDQPGVPLQSLDYPPGYPHKL